MLKLKSILPGILLCLMLATPGWLLGKAFPIIGGPVFGILFGMVLALLFSNKGPNTSSFNRLFQGGIKYTSKKLLQLSIILLGFEMNLYNVIKVGSQSLQVMLFTIATSFVIAFFVGKALKLKGKMTVLVGVGTSICGGSAIAAVAPVIQAEDEDVAQAISTIFLFNIVAVFLFPLLGRLLHMSDVGFGMWAGTAVNDTSSVVAAATSWSAYAGNNTALTLAAIVKLTRTLMIVPITLALAVYTTKKNSVSSKEGHVSSFRFSKVFPWFVLGFVAASILCTFTPIPSTFTHYLVTAGKFMITMAMCAIGLNTHLVKFIKGGWKPILLGLCCWFAVAGVSLLVQITMKLW